MNAARDIDSFSGPSSAVEPALNTTGGGGGQTDDADAQVVSALLAHLRTDEHAASADELALARGLDLREGSWSRGTVADNGGDVECPVMWLARRPQIAPFVMFVCRLDSWQALVPAATTSVATGRRGSPSDAQATWSHEAERSRGLGGRFDAVFGTTRFPAREDAELRAVAQELARADEELFYAYTSDEVYAMGPLTDSVARYGRTVPVCTVRRYVGEDTYYLLAFEICRPGGGDELQALVIPDAQEVGLGQLLWVCEDVGG